MTSIDKFSFALKKGFNELYQPSEVVGNEEHGFAVCTSFFSIARDGHGGVDIAKTYGFSVLRENDIDEHRKAYQKVGDTGYLDMLDKVEAVLSSVKSGESSVDEINEQLHQKTEDFYQKYIAGETITQVYNPTARNFIPDNPEDPNDAFVHRRKLQQWDELIGQENEIPHERIRKTWRLD